MMVFRSSGTMSAHNDTDVERLMMSSWSTGTTEQFLLDEHNKLMLDTDMDSLPGSDTDQKNNIMDADLETLFKQTTADMNKPLPPFTTGFAGNISINGISGHHYHAIAHRIPEENNNGYTINPYHTNGYATSSTENNIVSSSTCLPDSALMEPDTPLSDIKLFSDNSIDSKPFIVDSCGMNGADSVSSPKIFVDSKELDNYDLSAMPDDFASMLNTALADTTVPNKVEHEDGSRDSWMDLDALMQNVTPEKFVVSSHDALGEYIIPHSPGTRDTALQGLMSTHGWPILHTRLTQNGPPIKVEAPSSTSYCGELTSSTSTSPPGSVCSTTDTVLLNSQYMRSNPYNMKPDGLSSPDQNYAHTTTSMSSNSNKNKRPRMHKKQQITVAQAASSAATNMNFQTTNDLSGLMGKEKTVHRCHICLRGFLNKSNIKVHLRTHTGEKPFRCEVCSKAFRQKAHLIKHQQIHKRIGRD